MAALTHSPVSLQFARVAFTGRLASMTRREAVGIVRAARGVPVANVSRRTSMLVVGMEGWPLLPDATVSRKLQRAEAINRSGGRIAIVSEDDFLELAGLQERRPRLHKTYPADQVCALTGIDGTTLRRFEIFGLVRAEDGLYDFQDIVSLKTIAELIGRGADPAVIGRSIRGLASILPGTDRPLAQLKLIADDPGMLQAELGELRLAPDGQLMLNFAPPERRDAAAIPASFHDAPQAATAEAWFERGQELEEQERLEEAEQAYRQAMSRQPVFAEAQFNLGNVLRGLGRLDAAEERFRMAIDQDDALAAAWYNLADLQEETQRFEDAIESLGEALRRSPHYADAHFNLAYLLERVGRNADASKHWAAYLKLDPASEWADIARRHLGS